MVQSQAAGEVQMMERAHLAIFRVLELLHTLDDSELAASLPSLATLCNEHRIDKENAMVVYRPLLRRALTQWHAPSEEQEEGQAAAEDGQLAGSAEGEAAGKAPVNGARVSSAGGVGADARACSRCVYQTARTTVSAVWICNATSDAAVPCLIYGNDD
jgi:hypothetical protein